MTSLKYFLPVLLLTGSAQILADNSRTDYDINDNGLIEINDLDDLNAEALCMASTAVARKRVALGSS